MINNEQVKEYIADFQKRELPELVERKLEIATETEKIITIIGPRRAGKTYFLFQIMKKLLKSGVRKEQILYLNFEDPRLTNASFEEIKEIIKLYWQMYNEKQVYLFIDEPQSIDKWESAVRGLYDEGFKIYITGSSSKLLSREIATSLRGRSLSYLMLPFSFKEFLQIKDKNFDIGKLSSKEKSELLGLLEEFFDFGSFPEVIKAPRDEDKIKIIESYFELAVFKDIIERYHIKNSKLIKWLIKSVISSFSNEVSINKIYQILKSQNIKASKNTLYSYFSFLEDSFFAFSVPKFSFSERKKDLLSNKIYVSDTGFVKLIESSRESGKKMENAVFLELLRNKKTLEEINFWKNQQGQEVDFVLSGQKKVKSLVQACYDINNLDTKKREIISLLNAGKELKCKNLIILTFDYEKEEEHEWFGNKRKIKFIPLWKWLLS